MFRPLALLLSWRYLRTRDVTLLFVTKTAGLGLIVSITVLLVVQGIVAGFQRTLQQDVLGFIPHVTFSRPTGMDAAIAQRVIDSVPSVATAAMVVQHRGLVSTAQEVRRAQFIGLDPDVNRDFMQTLPRTDTTPWGELEDGKFGILLGSELARELDVAPGDSVLLTFATGGMSPFGFKPRQKRFVVRGVSRTYSQLDSMVAYIHRNDARRLLQLSAEANAAYFKLNNPLEIANAFFPMYAAANERLLLANTWQDLFGSLFNFLVRFKNLLFLLLSLLVAVATFNLVSSMVMLVHSRRADVAVLRTIGGNSSTVLFSFLATAWVLALASLVLCVLFAWLIGLALPWLHGALSQLIGVSLADGFPLHRLTIDLQFEDVIRVVGLTLLMVTLGALYPAWRATQAPPSEILRDE